MSRFITNEDFKQIYSLGEYLGSGISGDVYMAKETATNKILAIKQIEIDNTNFSTDTEVLTIDSEEGAWSKFYEKIGEMITILIEESEDIVKIHDYFIIRGEARNTSKFCLIMDYYETSLQKIINHHRENRENMGLLQIIAILRDVALGLEKLRENRIAHRDLKPSNIMRAAETKKFKIIDFGESILNFEYTLTAEHTVVGTLNYMAPEVKKKAIQNSYSYAVYNPYAADVFSLGMIALELALINNKERFIFGKLLVEEKYNDLLKAKITLMENVYKNKIFSDLIFRMLSYDYKKRPTYKQIIETLDIISQSANEVPLRTAPTSSFTRFDLGFGVLLFNEFTSKYTQIWCLTLFYSFSGFQSDFKTIQSIIFSVFAIINFLIPISMRKLSFFRQSYWIISVLNQLASILFIGLCSDSSVFTNQFNRSYFISIRLLPTAFIVLIFQAFKDPYEWMLRDSRYFFDRISFLNLAQFLGVFLALSMADYIGFGNIVAFKGNSFCFNLILPCLSFIFLLVFRSRLITTQYPTNNESSSYEILLIKDRLEGNKRWENTFFYFFQISYCFGSSLIHYFPLELLSSIQLRYSDYYIMSPDVWGANPEPPFSLTRILLLGLPNILLFFTQKFAKKIGCSLYPFLVGMLLSSVLAIVNIMIYSPEFSSNQDANNQSKIFLLFFTLITYDAIFLIFANINLEKIILRLNIQRLLVFRNSTTIMIFYIYCGAADVFDFNISYTFILYALLAYVGYNLLVLFPSYLYLSKLSCGSYFKPLRF